MHLHNEKHIGSKFILILGVCCSFLLSNLTFAEESKQWTVSIEPYVMFTSISGTAGMGRVAGAPVSVRFSDILKNLQFAGMIHTEAHHRSGWGVLVDYGFMNLGADLTGPLGGVTNASVKQGILEILVSRSFMSSNFKFELLGGVRWWNNKIDITLNPVFLPGSPSVAIRESWVDPIIGGRVTIPLFNKLDFLVRADVGGFGIGSDFTSQVSAGIHYHITEMISIDLQYKALWVNYKNGVSNTPGSFSYDTVTSGPLLGIIFEL